MSACHEVVFCWALAERSEGRGGEEDARMRCERGRASRGRSRQEDEREATEEACEEEPHLVLTLLRPNGVCKARYTPAHIKPL